jgi:release factor glutamine methyltransferase
VIAANAPYVPTVEIPLLPREAREHEPRGALDGGGDGLSPHRRLIAAAPDWLAPEGALVFEVAIDQVPAAVSAVEAGGLAPVTVSDDELEVAVVAATRS